MHFACALAELLEVPGVRSLVPFVPGTDGMEPTMFVDASESDQINSDKLKISIPDRSRETCQPMERIELTNQRFTVGFSTRALRSGARRTMCFEPV